MNLFKLNVTQTDNDYYIALAIERIGANLARRYSNIELVIIGKGIDADIVECTLKTLKVVA